MTTANDLLGTMLGFRYLPGPNTDKDVVILEGVARNVYHNLISFRDIPEPSHQWVRKTHKMFMESSSGGDVGWFHDNRKTLASLHRRASTLPVRKRTSSSTTYPICTSDVDVRKSVKEASRMLLKSDVKNAKTLLRGNVIVLPHSADRHAGRYLGDTDRIVLYSGVQDVEHTFLHEIGHRVWNLRLDQSGKEDWLTFHRTRMAMHKKRVQDAFPSEYSLMSPEEHFCESFAAYVMGDADSSHRAMVESLTT